VAPSRTPRQPGQHDRSQASRAARSPRQGALYVAARAPRPGFAKSRLGRAIGHPAAVTLYGAFLRDLGRRFSVAPFAVGWYITPDDGWPEIAPLVAGTGQDGPVIAQPDGDWTERQRALFAGAAARGEQRTVLVASDSPHLEVETVAEAFRRLDHDDLVLGPTDDGGYYLIGMRAAPERRPWDVLTGVRMSTGTVLDELCGRAGRLGLRAGLLPPTFDIDEVGDLDRLVPLALHRNDLLATRVALARCGLLAPAAEGAPSPAAEPVATVSGGRP